jgi:hypothetical protein
VRDDELTAAILQRTLTNAVRAPYYARAFGDRWQSVRTLVDYATLPLLDKQTAIRHQRELLADTPPAGFGVASSGTTRVDLDLPPLNVLTTPEELGAGADFGGADFGRGFGGADDHSSGAEGGEEDHPGWTLVCVSVNHGLPIGAPRPDEIFVPWMIDRNSLYMIETVLSSVQPDGRRVTAMRLSGGAIKVLTAWLLERGKDPAALGVKLIGTNSFGLSRSWRALVERRFAAEIFDNYSLSEFATPATECKACGWLHFGWPPVLFEVLDLVSGRSLESGAGRLVLSGLHPWSRIMPLLRYDTGDVVELGPTCPATGAQGVRALGRVRRGLVVDDGGAGRFILASRFIVDALDERPDTERDLHPFSKLGLMVSRDVGLPRFTVALDGGVATLRFEVRFDPHLFERQTRDVESEVRSALLHDDQGLASLVDAARVRFDVVACRPRSLQPPPDKYD